MAKTTSTSSLFADFKPPKIEQQRKQTKEDAFREEIVKEEIAKEETAPKVPANVGTTVPSDKPSKKEEEPNDLQALVQAEISRMMAATPVSVAAPAKVGRPKKYVNSSRVVSVRLDLELYEYARKKGRLEYDGLTDYINHLIRKEMKEV